MANRMSGDVDVNPGNSNEDEDTQIPVLADDDAELDDDFGGQRELLPQQLVLNLSRALLRRLSDSAREEGVTMEDLASELISEGVVLRAWEIVEKKATMRGGPNAQPQGQSNFNRGNSNAQPNNNNHNHQRNFGPGNKMAQKKLQRQTRQHANAMDLMADKAAFIEYVRNQEKKRR
jgi:hypothetical protein